MHPVTRPTFRVKPYAHPKYKFVVRAKLAGKWKRSYFKSEAEAAAYAANQNVSLEKHVKRQRSGRVRSDGHTNGTRNWHEFEKSNRRSTVSSQAVSRKAIVVLGMHRSGTSALCGALDVLGVNFGQRLAAATKNNEKGHWEHPEIVGLHDELLCSLGSRWDNDRPLPSDWVERDITRDIRSLLIGILEHDFAHASLFGLKDPRMCRLMPLWLPIFQTLRIEPHFVLMVRHPWEVAESLAKRDGLEHPKSYLLWLEHLVQAISATRAHQRSVVCYEEMIDDPVKVLTGLRKELGVNLRAPFRVRTSLRKFLEPSLRHHHLKKGRANKRKPPVPHLALDLYETLRDASTSVEIGEKTAPLVAQFGRGGELFYPRVNLVEAELASLDKEIAKSEETGMGSEGLVRLAVYHPVAEGYRQTESQTRYFASRSWKLLVIDLPGKKRNLDRPLRIDPVTYPAVIDIAEIALKRPSTGEILWAATESTEFAALTVGGTACRLAHEPYLRILSFGNDPQLLLPQSTTALGDSPLRLELSILVDASPEAISTCLAENKEHVRNIEQQKNVAEDELKQRGITGAVKNAEFHCLNAEIERKMSELERQAERMGVVLRLKEELKQRDATIAVNNAEFQRLNAEIERISSAFSRAQNDLKERERSISDIQAQLTESRQQHERNIEYQAELTDKLIKLNQDVKSFAEVFGLTRQRLQDSDSAAAVLIQSLFHDIRLIRKRKSLWKACRMLRSALSREGTQDIPSNPKITAEALKQKLQGIQRTLKSKKTPPAIALNALAELIVLQNRVHQALDLLSLGSLLRLQQKTVTAHEPLGNLVTDAAKAGFEGCLDLPFANTTNTGLFHVTGWLYLKSRKLTQLVARVRGGASVTLTHGLPRPDAAKAFPQFPSAAKSGFEGYVPIDLGFAGCVTLELHAITEDGTDSLCFQREVTLRSPGTSPPDSYPLVPLVETNPYTEWVRTNRLTRNLLKKMGGDADRIARTGPRISIVVPVYNTPGSYLEALIDSVRSQLYQNWQLCLADDASPEPHVRPILERAASTDSRIQVSWRDTNGHIVKASNSALELATGDYVGLLDHDDILSPDALLHVAEAIAAEPALDLLYTDEDKFSPSGERYDPIFKGSFSPEMAITHNYIQHFTVIRRSLLQSVRGFREGFEGAQDLDLYLRVLEKTTPEHVRHLPFVCYHWRSHPESTASTGAQKNYVFESARKSIAEALVRRKLRATPFLPDFAAEDNCCLYQLRWSRELLKENPVTIVIPTKNRDDLLEKCIASLVRTVDPAYVKLIVVDDFSEDESTRRYLKELAAGKPLSCNVIQPSSRSDAFNFSQLVNEGVARATTPLVLLLNNDIEAIQPGWLEDMVGWMSIDGVGAVGAKLLYPDSTIQHAGVVVGEHLGLAGHIFHRLGKDIIGLNFLSHAARNVSAVTAACMLTSKAVFDEVNGFDQANFAMEWNDVDYCLRLGQAGKRIVFTPQAVLLHHCGKSRGRLGFRPQEHVNFLRRYRGIKDPFYNESLDLDRLPVAAKPRHFVHTARVGKLKVLVISHNLNFEGAPRVLFDRACYFASVGGYEVTVVSPLDGPLRKHFEDAGISVNVVKTPFPQVGENEADYTERLRVIGERLRASSLDLIICNTLISIWGVSLAKLFDRPVIWNIHESNTLEHFLPSVPALAGVAEDCFASADRVVFEANAAREVFNQYDSRENFITIAGSVDVDAIDEFCERHERDLLRRKHGIDTNQTVVSLIGTTCRRKGQHVFLQAIKKLQSEHPSVFAEVCFLMVGARESLYLDFLRAQIESSQATNLRLVEEREDIYDFYRLSDIFVCASFEESFPRVILEAMAFKLGIVSTNVFGIPEIVSDGGEALLVPAGDACSLAQRILRLVQKPQNRKQLGDRAYAKVNRSFTNRGQLRKHLDLTKEVVARHD